MAVMSASMASSGSGGTLSIAAEFPGEFRATAASVANRSRPTTPGSVPAISPYAASSASPFAAPRPRASRRFPPSTNAVTTASQAPLLDWCVTVGRDESTSSRSCRPKSASARSAALCCSLSIRPTFGGSDAGSTAPSVANRIDANASAMAKRCASFLL